MKNKWKVRFYIFLTTLMVTIIASLIITLYIGLDHGVSMTYLQDSYTCIEQSNDLLMEMVMLDELNRETIEHLIENDSLLSRFGYIYKNNLDTLYYNRIALRFENDKLVEIIVDH